MIHGAIALVICAVMLLLHIPWVGMLLPALFYVGREVTQAEYRYIEAHGGKRNKCPWYCGLKPIAWTTKSVLDVALPLIVSVAAIVVEVLWLHRS